MRQSFCSSLRASVFVFRAGVFFASFLFSVFCFPPTALAQADVEVLARARVFPEISAGAHAVKRDAAGRYYVLTRTPSGGAVFVFDASGKRLAQIPSGSEKSAAIQYGDDLDVSAAARIYVADREADNVKVFEADGRLALTVSIPAPTSVVALSEGEFAVSSMRTAKLVTVFTVAGKISREFGDPVEISERTELNRFLNIGHLAADSASNLYYSFSFLPEPLVRKYDRFGYAAFEIELATLEFQPAAQATRREIERQARSRGAPAFKLTVNALAVEPEAQEIWLAIGGRLLHFDSDGIRRGTYRIFTPDGIRLEASAILVEPERLLVASETLGIFELPRPDKIRR